MSIGQGICVLGGRERWAWWAPGVGFAALLFLGGLVIQAPGHSKTAAIVAAAALTALVALGALGGAARPSRWVAALLVGVCYLAASFTVQASFKETIEALLVITVALAARERSVTALAGIPLGIVVGG